MEFSHNFKVNYISLCIEIKFYCHIFFKYLLVTIVPEKEKRRKRKQKRKISKENNNNNNNNNKNDFNTRYEIK